MKSLTEEQVAQFKRDGFLSPFPLLNEAERQECLRGLARYEKWLGMPVNAAKDLTRIIHERSSRDRQMGIRSGRTQ